MVPPVPDDIVDWFGDFRWWSRADLFSNPQCAEFVPSVTIAIDELRKFYDAASCRKMVLNGASCLIVGHFLGVTGTVEAVPLDWIAFFNGHMLGASGRWTIDLGPCRVSPSSPEIPEQVLDGITGWGEG